MTSSSFSCLTCETCGVQESSPPSLCSEWVQTSTGWCDQEAEAGRVRGHRILPVEHKDAVERGSLTETYICRVVSDRWRYTCSVYEPSRAWVTNEQGSRPVATSSRSCRHNRYLQKTKMCHRDNMHEKSPQLDTSSPIPWDQHQQSHLLPIPSLL